MPAYQVTRSIHIEKPINDVRTYLQDFRNWPAWSPWLIQEPSATLTYKGTQGEVDSSYAWEGKRIGAGSMLLSSMRFTADTHQALHLKLQILKPFKSKADVWLELEARGEGATHVTWVMNSSIPFFMFFLKKMLMGMIGMDYDRGLAMLKSQLETGRVLSALTLVGERRQETLHYVAVSAQSTLKNMGDTWSQGITDLMHAIESQQITPLGAPFGLYHRMDMSTTHTDFSICVPIAAGTSVSSPLEAGVIEACDTYVVSHQGAYQHIGNAWSMGYSASRADKIKLKSKPVGMEIYMNDPSDTDEKDLITEVILFKK